MENRAGLTKKLFRPSLWLKGVDRWILIIVGILLVFGLVMLASASSVVAYGTYGDSYYFFKRQLVAILVGSVFFLILANFNYRRLKDASMILLLINILALVMVLFFGKVVNGTRGWLNIFGLNVQPSEPLKLVYLTYLAAKFSGVKKAQEAFGSFITSFIVIAFLIFLQPDVGTLFILAVASLGTLIIAKIPARYLIGLATVGIIGLSFAVAGSEHQRNRFHCVVDPAFSPKEYCYQVNQSLIALGSGGFFGRGLGESRQKFLYLPEVQNDFIFAVIGEEMGFVFSAGIIILFAVFFWRIYRLSQITKDPFGRLLAIGIIFWICFQTILNIGGIARVLPMTGVPLPFISYGGSAIVSLLAAMGVLANISREA